MIVVDIDAGAAFSQWQYHKSPTLTRTRSRSGGFWLSTHERRMTQDEMMKIQGLTLHSFGDYFELGITRAAVNTAIGNAMSCNIIERLCCKALCTVALVEEPMADRWEDPEFAKKGAYFARSMKSTGTRKNKKPKTDQ